MEEHQHLVDEIKRKDAEIIVTLQDIAEVALTEEAKEPVAAGEEGVMRGGEGFSSTVSPTVLV